MAGQRAGARRGPKPPRSAPSGSVTFVMGALGSLILWGGLVWGAIHLGNHALRGNQLSWLWMALVGLAATAALGNSIWLTRKVFTQSADPGLNLPAKPKVVGGRRSTG